MSSSATHFHAWLGVTLLCMCCSSLLFTSYWAHVAPSFPQRASSLAPTSNVGGHQRERDDATCHELEQRVPFTDHHIRCSRWIVTTTIALPTTQLLHVLARNQEWCVVIVLDKKTPTPYPSIAHRSSLVVLSVEEQEHLALTLNTIRFLPWNHFARKTIGYLYAVAHGAVHIYDLDDDNVPTKPLDQVVDPLQSLRGAGADSAHFFAISQHQRLAVYRDGGRTPVFNHHPYYGDADGWARGFPLSRIRDVRSDPRAQPMSALAFNSTGERAVASLFDAPLSELAQLFPVRQSLADIDPDVDALYRLARALPVRFTRKGVLAIRRGTYAPFNAQATFFSYNAFFGLLLPATVHGRVSDIWRAYLLQPALWAAGGRVLFHSAEVEQFRNAHSYLSDMQAEEPLYHQVSELLDSIAMCTTNGDTPTVQDVYLCAVDAAVRIDAMGPRDACAARAFLSDLQWMGYVFPTPSVSSEAHDTLERAQPRVPLDRKRSAVCVLAPFEDGTWSYWNALGLLERWLGSRVLFDVFVVREEDSYDAEYAQYFQPRAVIESEAGFGSEQRSNAHRSRFWMDAATCARQVQQSSAQEGITYGSLTAIRANAVARDDLGGTPDRERMTIAMMEQGSKLSDVGAVTGPVGDVDRVSMRAISENAQMDIHRFLVENDVVAAVREDLQLHVAHGCDDNYRGCEYAMQRPCSLTHQDSA